jgi:signal transduction histidine kinase
MNDSSFKSLRQALASVSQGHTQQEKMDALLEAFSLFSYETERLQTAYRLLKEQFEAVNTELEESNRQLTLKIAELDVVTYYLDSILSNITQGILFIDFIGNVTTYNTAAQQILEVERLDVVFEPFWSHFKDDHFGFSMRQALKNKTAPRTQLATITLPSGAVREIEVDTTFVLQKNSTIGGTRRSPTLDAMKGVIILIRDLTDLRRLQAVASRNDRMKELGEMAAMVAHEIRNPLGGIKGFASLLQRDLSDRPQQQQMAQYIVEGTDTLNSLVNQVLDYARPLDMHLEHHDILPLIHSLHVHLEADQILTAAHSLRIETQLNEVRIPVDIIQLRSALLNLLLNAVQSMPKGGEITIKLWYTGSILHIAIVDQGEGIAAVNLEKIFSPFFTTKPKGNGLGLSEVHKIIRAHGGTIDVVSVVGEGSTFTLQLPSIS